MREHFIDALRPNCRMKTEAELPVQIECEDGQRTEFERKAAKLRLKSRLHLPLACFLETCDVGVCLFKSCGASQRSAQLVMVAIVFSKINKKYNQEVL